MTAVAGRRQSPARVTDRGRLAVDLAETLRGEVRFDRGAQAMYASDRGRPKGPRCCCGRTLSPTTSPQGSRPPACLKTPTAGSGYRSGPCARGPCYDYGMLPTAKRWLRRILAELREPILRRQPRPRRPRTHRKAAAKIVCELQGTD